MKKCLYIEVDEQGVVTVGAAEKDDSEVSDVEMQPADNLDAAFAMGREILEGNPEEEAEGEAAFAQGYKENAGEDMSMMTTKGMR